jgi:divalent metal cation (Fe/Co/Zn/Cd) transporter
VFLSDAAESNVNLVAAIVAVIAVRVAARPAYDDHATPQLPDQLG